MEGIVFHTKSKKERLQENLQDSLHDSTASLASGAAVVADQLRERVVPAVGHAAESAKEWGQPRVEAARHWAKPHVEHGIEVAAPKLESAVSGLAPKVDTARDKIVEELLPRVTEAITAFAAATGAARDEAVSRGAGAASVISGDAVASPKHKKKGRLLLAVGGLAAAAAGAAAFLRRSAPKDDPWATPIADPYVSPSSERQSRVMGDGDATSAGSIEADSEFLAFTDQTDAQTQESPQDVVTDTGLAEKPDRTRRDTKKQGTQKASPEDHEGTDEGTGA